MALKSFRGLMNPSFRQVNEGQPILQPGQALAAGYYSGGQAAAPGSGSMHWSTPGTYTVQVGSGVTRGLFFLVGGGGGGAGSSSTSYYGGNGGSAGFVMALIELVPNDTLTIVVGTGGSAGSDSASGANGTSSSISSSAHGWSILSGYGEGGTPGTSTGNGSSGSYVSVSQTGNAFLLVISSNGFTQNPGGSSYASALQLAYGFDITTNNGLYPTNFGQASPSSNPLAGAGGVGTTSSAGNPGNNGAVVFYW